jgi:hypothetical protein
MSATLNFNEKAYVPWKGQTFNQIVSSIQKNTPETSTVYGATLRKALPLKIYRKELASANVTNYNPRQSISIDELNSPNGYFIIPSANNPCITGAANRQGISNTLDINLTNDTYERPGLCPSILPNGACSNIPKNALNRVRSSKGVISKKYYTSTQQYLASRCQSFEQNQYNYIRSGNPNVKPGTAAALNNTYAANQEVTSCNTPICNKPVFYKPNNSQFAQQGGVSSSARVARLKYDTITNEGAIFYRTFGTNNVSYTGLQETYSIKDRIGFPLSKTPVIQPFTGAVMQCCVQPPLPKKL